MPAKAPIYLKNGGGKNGQGNGRNGKKLRELLSAEMISPPLGDFRHMAHVGRGGAEDMFGDTTFLQKDNLNGEPENSDSVTTLPRRESKKRSKKQRNHSTPDENALNAEVKSLTTDGYGPAQSPILQSAFSLPVLSNGTSPSPEPQENKKAGVKKTMNNNCVGDRSSPQKSPALPDQTPNGNATGPPKPRRIMDDPVANGNPKGLGDVDKHGVYNRRPCDLGDTTSITDGWDLDLGSSLMDDVMGIMDRIEL